MPSDFDGRRKGDLNSNRVFSEIQRLNVFGLIETRQRTIFHIPGSAKEERLRRTREGVYSTREDFRIDHWGKHYVEFEIRDKELLARVEDLVRSRQNVVLNHLLEMAQAYPEDPFMTTSENPKVMSRVMRLREFYLRSRKISEEIRQAGGCAMIFRLK